MRKRARIAHPGLDLGAPGSEIFVRRPVVIGTAMVVCWGVLGCSGEERHGHGQPSPTTSPPSVASMTSSTTAGAAAPAPLSSGLDTGAAPEQPAQQTPGGEPAPQVPGPDPSSDPGDGSDMSMQPEPDPEAPAAMEPGSSMQAEPATEMQAMEPGPTMESDPAMEPDVPPDPDLAMESGPMMDPPGRTPVYRIPLRVHVGDSILDDDELRQVLEEVNTIWLSQAGICFEIHTVDHDDVMREGFDFWFRSGAGRGLNGQYSGPHSIFSVDYPSLGGAPNPTEHPASRTTAHELGHGLSLQHDNCGDACYDKLMSSGRKGWQLDDGEIEAARARAPRYALEDTDATACAPPMTDR